MNAAACPLPEQTSRFAASVVQLRKRILSELGDADLRHLRKIALWGRLCTLAGYMLAPWFINPVAAVLLSQGNLTRWLLMHHISHRGYDRVPNVPQAYTSAHFARGWRRFVDWFDWILPEAWAHEHNVLHHYNTNEVLDPDLVENNLAGSWVMRQPMWVRYVAVAFFAMTWKLSYYAPNTFRELENAARKRAAQPPHRSWWPYFNPLWRGGWAFWRRCLLPYGLVRFVALPLCFYPLGRTAVAWVWINSLIAEIFTNLHTFAAIAPNHAGDDLYRYETADKDKAEHYARQVMGSVNYHCGNDRLDFAQMWLNYQIEHHIWPDLTMLQYRRWQPHVRQLCAEHGLPYVQESIFKRVRKLIHIMVGRTQMRRIERVSAAVKRLPAVS